MLLLRNAECDLAHHPPVEGLVGPPILAYVPSAKCHGCQNAAQTWVHREIAVAVGWLDARNAAGNNQAQYFVSASLDGGATFLPNVQVAARLSNANTANTGGFDFGAFDDLDFSNNSIHAVWHDNTSGFGNPDLPNFDMGTAIIILDTNGVRLAMATVNGDGIAGIVTGAGAGGRPHAKGTGPRTA